MADGFPHSVPYTVVLLDPGPLEIPQRSIRRIKPILVAVAHREYRLFNRRAERNLHFFSELLRVLPRERAKRDGKRVALRRGRKARSVQRQRVQLNQELHPAPLHKLLAALVRGEHAVDEVRRVGNRLHEKRRRELLLRPGLRRRVLLRGVRVHPLGRITRGARARVGIRLCLLDRVLVVLVRRLHDAAAQLHQAPEHVHREIDAHVLERRHVPEQLVQVAADRARRLALQKLGVGASGERVDERV